MILHISKSLLVEKYVSVTAGFKTAPRRMVARTLVIP